MSEQATYKELVEEALGHCNDAAWLGRKSKLATPYFLGDRAIVKRKSADPALQRGLALQNLLEHAFFALIAPDKPRTFEALNQLVEQSRQAIGNKGNWYHFYILEMLFFKRYFRADKYPTKNLDLIHFLNVSASRFYEHRKQAIAAFAESLLKLCQPTSRLERPDHDKRLFGRSALLADCLATLAQGQNIAITGQGGVGKSAFAVAIRKQWPQQMAFWYTIRPQLNDNILDFLFALGHFLQQFGQTRLWLQLLADQSRISNVEQMLGFIRLDLQALAQPLIIIDEIDLLVSFQDRPNSAANAQLVELLAALRGVAPLLLVGQQAVIDTEVHHQLTGLAIDHTQAMLHHAQVALSQREIAALHNATLGNPRLIELALALLDTNEQVSALVKLLQKGSARPLFLRLWKRLSAAEKKLVCLLSVFRGIVPLSELADYQPQITQLKRRYILQEDGSGGCSLLPYLRLLAYEELTVDLKEALHEHAATIRARLGEFTPAAHHLVRANLAAAAIDFWYERMSAEIARGQAARAMHIFSAISSKGLQKASLRRLKIIQNQLLLLRGDAEAIVANMEGIDWLEESVEDAKVYHQLALAQMRLNDTESSFQHYNTVIDTLDEAVLLLIVAYHEQSQLQYRDPSVYTPHNRIGEIEFTVAIHKGFLADVVRDLPQASEHYRVAIELAEVANRPLWIARSHYLLATVLSQQGNIVEAKRLYERALKIYGDHGDLFLLENVRAEFAGMYINARQFAKARPLLENNLQFFEQVKDERRIAITSNNLAEAYFELGELTNAKALINRVLQLEVMRSRPYALYTLGLIHQQEKQFAFAETAFLEGIVLAKQTQDRFIEAYLQRNLGNLYAAQGEHDRAMSSLHAALRLFEAMNIKPEIAATQERIVAVEQ